VDRQLGGDLGAVDDEGFLELVLQLEQFPDRGAGDAQGSKQECRGAAELGRGLAGQPVDDLDQLAGGPGAGVVGVCVPRMSSVAVTSSVALLAVRP